jgi:tetratricopeptide (TPR) repeat protein
MIPFFLSAALSLESLDALGTKKMASGHYKEAIQAFSELSEKEEGLKKGKSLKDLSIAYYKDQNHEMAFKTFLEALTAVTPSERMPLQNDKALYEQALKIYLDPRERDPNSMSLRIRDVYGGMVRLHPEYLNLGYLVALADANLGDYTDFFEIFFRSYKGIPAHFLAEKTKGILHIKLYERARTAEEKEKERQAIFQAFQKAKELFPEDASLYRLQIAYAPNDMKVKVLEQNLNEIIDHDRVVPRSDLSFYFNQLLEYGKYPLAKEFLEKAKHWYPYSRTLTAATDMIEAREKTNGNYGKENGTSSPR